MQLTKMGVFVCACAFAMVRAQQQPAIEATQQDVTVHAENFFIKTQRDNTVGMNVGDKISQLETLINLISQQVTAVNRSAQTRADQLHNDIMNDHMTMNQSVGQIQNDLQATQAHVAQLEGIVNRTANATDTGFTELRDRLDLLESHYWNATDAQNILGTYGDFEDNGNATHISHYNRDLSYGLQWQSLVALQAGDRPPVTPRWGTLTYALQLGPGVCTGSDSSCFGEYEVNVDGRNFCAGVYELKAWARVTNNFNGARMLLHNRFWFVGGGALTWGHEYTQTPQSVGVGEELGAFPRSYDWQQIQATMRIPPGRVANRFALYLGYPFRGDQGYVQVTGLEMSRVGGDGAC